MRELRDEMLRKVDEAGDELRRKTREACDELWQKTRELRVEISNARSDFEDHVRRVERKVNQQQFELASIQGKFQGGQRVAASTSSEMPAALTNLRRELEAMRRQQKVTEDKLDKMVRQKLERRMKKKEEERLAAEKRLV